MAKNTEEKGERVRRFFNSEAKALVAVHKNIEMLIPSSIRSGSAHTGEEGRYIEALIRSHLNKHLPGDLEALSGFILRPATKVGRDDRSRRANEEDEHSNQLDVIVYDTRNYPTYERFEEFVIVPPEGVVAIISVKKNLYEQQLADEIKALGKAAELCRVKNSKGEPLRGPATAIVSFGNMVREKGTFEEKVKAIYSAIEAASSDYYFDKCLGSVICLDSCTVFKKRPNDEFQFDGKAVYIAFDHSNEAEYHFGLQFLLTGILAAYYHDTRKAEIRPGFTSFPTRRKHNLELGAIDVRALRWRVE